MARVYGVKVDDTLADEIKRAWRESHPRIVHYWHDLESAAINAVELGCVCKSGPAGRQIAWKKDGSFLWCRLPSGRVLCYPYPVVKEIETPWGEMKPALHFMSVNSVTNKWEETKTYGGSLAENVTQAVARDLLAEAIVRFEENGVNIIMHCHDEIVAEVKRGSLTLDQAEHIMCVSPAWATGLPLAAEGYVADRYRK
jgi:DNA polymerase